MFISRENAQSIVNEMKSLLGYNINIMNEEGRIIASTDPLRIGQLHEGANNLIQNKMDRLVIEAGSDFKNTRPGINFPIVIDNSIVGVIGVTGMPADVLTLGNVIKRMTELMVESLQQKEKQLMINAARSRFLSSWIEWDGSNADDFYNRGKALGIDTNIKYSVLCVNTGFSELYQNRTSEKNSPDMLFSKFAELSGLTGRELYCFSDDLFIFLVPEKTNEHLLGITMKLHSKISEQTNETVYVGISSHSGSQSEIAILFREARSACRIAKQSSNSYIQFYRRSDPEFIAGSISEDIRVSLINSVFGACSKERREEYAELLQSYYRHNGNMNEAAAAMYIHRNTFQYRLDKMTKETGFSVNRSSDNFILYLVSIWCRKYK